MQTLEILLASLSSIGIAHALFIAVLLWFWKHGNRYLNRILSVMLIAFAVRISKSVLFFLFQDMPEIAPAIGVTGQAVIGPALFLYVRDFIRKNQQDIGFSFIDLVHFLPGLIIMISIPFHTATSLHYTYLFVITHLILYWMATAGYAWNHRNKLRQPAFFTWILLLLGGSFMIWCVYVSQLIGGSTLFYLIVTSISALTLFGLSFIAMQNYNVLNRIPYIKGTNRIHGVSIENLIEKLEHQFEDQKIFTNPDLTLVRLAKQVDIPAYIVSKVINNEFHQSFPEYVNTYRMREAEQRLKDPAIKHLSIEAIAFECGFNNLSAFYNVFNKHHRQTPAQFREQYIVL